MKMLLEVEPAELHMGEHEHGEDCRMLLALLACTDHAVAWTTLLLLAVLASILKSKWGVKQNQSINYDSMIPNPYKDNIGN